MAHGTSWICIDRVDVEKIIASRIELLQLFAAALRQNNMTQVAIGGNDLLSIIRFVISVVATEATGRDFVADVVRVNAPVGLHFGKEIVLINLLRFGNQPVYASRFGVNGAQAG